jgi:hypothetical protein
VPGALGSFLTHIIELSDLVHSHKKDYNKWFEDNSTAHNQLTKWIDNFHDIDEVTSFRELDHPEQIRYIENNLVKLSDSHMVHRLCRTDMSKTLQGIFTNAKYIKITIGDHYDTVVNMMAHKTFATGVDTVGFNDLSSNLLNKLSVTEKKALYHKVCTKKVNAIYNDDQEQDCFSFPFENFLTWELFENTVQDLSRYLNFQIPINKHMYSKFHEVNSKFFKEIC